MLALTIAPVAGAWLLYYFWPPVDTVNYGELVEGRRLPDAALTLADGTVLKSSQWRGKWILAMIDSAACDPYCEKKLYIMRQLQRAQGKEMGRVERAFLITDQASVPVKRLAPYDGTWFVHAGRELLDAFPAEGSSTAHIYVIDPLGNVILRYPRDPDPRKMLKDLQRLLKVSRIG